MTLDVYSGMKVYGWDDDEDRKRFGKIYDRARQPGVTLHGSVGQPALLRSLARSGFLLYPNTFDETSCIAAIEAQAAGAVVITSDKAGLRETVDAKSGVRIAGDPSSPEYRRRFVEAVIGLSRNPGRHRAMSDAARERVRHRYSWRTIAGEWLDLFARMPASGLIGRWSGPLARLEKAHDYLAKGNRSASMQILRGLSGQPFFSDEIAKLENRLLEINGIGAAGTPGEPESRASTN
jgi:hypothetical protein